MMMKKTVNVLLPAVCTLALCSCMRALNDGPVPEPGQEDICTPRGVARMLAALPIGASQLDEVYEAVNSSSGNGFDEEYMMCDLLGSPGAGVGDGPSTRAAARARFDNPIRDMIADYLASVAVSTRAGAADVQEYLDRLSDSGMQIYWPYSEEWDGKQMPLVTFDPGYGAEKNWAYEISGAGGTFAVTDSVLVDENLAMERPVWVINSNSDSGFTPLQFFLDRGGAPAVRSSDDDWDDSWTADGSSRRYNLFMKDFTMLRNFDTWFAGASEFFVQCGSVYSNYTTAEAAAGNFSPEVTDLMVVVKRRDVGRRIPFNALLLSGFTEDLQQIAFLITESDGGTRTTWKCQAKLMIKSKSYGVELEIPFHSADDIVWRGQLDMEYLRGHSPVDGRFGDVEITFAVE